MIGKLGLILVGAIQVNLAHASGCSSYGDLRTTMENKLVSEDWALRKYKILSTSDNGAVIQHLESGRQYMLGWEKSEKVAEAPTTEMIQTRDVLFEEGNGCGPVFRCVTGQLVLKIFDRQDSKVHTFSFPTILEAQEANGLPYVSRDLLPVFGPLKLDVPSLAEQGAQGEPADAHQCGYGNW